MRHEIEKPYRRYEQRELASLLGRRSRFGRWADVIVSTARLWLDRWRMRRRMVADIPTFNDAMFEDAGTTRAAAEKEARKPFWRA